MRSCQDCSNANFWQDLGKILPRYCQDSSRDLGKNLSWQDHAKNLAKILPIKNLDKILAGILPRSCQDKFLSRISKDLGKNLNQDRMLGNSIVVKFLFLTI